MQIRVMGTKQECEQAGNYYSKLAEDTELVSSCSISVLYPNRNSTNQYRIYIDITCKNAFYEQARQNNSAVVLKK